MQCEQLDSEQLPNINITGDAAIGRYGLSSKPACESTQRWQNDEQNIEHNPSATACNVTSVGYWRMENA
ncbi:MAG: hypothetical protein ACK56W_14630 [Pirellula sp.]|jgi:hypothetical protein